ncbi:restriction endonuclease [Fusibacter bizertensis]|uniref:Restriction endonuclease n=1 Tax=Fusibacter bizertensis TaxID=1488331 RepID=A0ABT6N962_9FIRM|nr:restriction endonuclease [Fusibacter bizertensis]MDH8676956.1 restriction endonuclease [Fusibacter bizertensis]
MKNTGKDYEKLIQRIYQQILDIDGHNIEVQHNVSIPGRIEGIEYQVDVFYEFYIGDIHHRVIIECKDHKEAIKLNVVEAFKTRLNEIGNCTGILIAKSGFQKGAKLFADANGIMLLVGTETNLSLKVILKSIEKLLPDEKVIGQPFWTIMEEKDGKVTGTYCSYGDEGKHIILFDSKLMATEFLNKRGTKGVVRGVSQMHLRGIIAMAKLGMCKLGIMYIFKPGSLYELEPDRIEEAFLVI